MNQIATLSEPSGTAPREPFSGRLLRNIRARIIAGLLLVLPVFITFWVLYWLYSLLSDYVIEPAARVAVYLGQGRPVGTELPPALERYWAPLFGIVLVLCLLYVAGLFVRSRVVGAVDWLLLRTPVVTPVYRVVRKMFEAFQVQGGLASFKRVVLVAFPHPGMRVPGFVTATCRDASTGRNILCIYVPTTPVPSSGYMLLVPEDEVTELDWSLEETIQAVVSGGISVPPQVRYYRPGPGEE